MVYRERCDKQKSSSQQQSCGRKLLVDERLKENGTNSASEQAGHKQANTVMAQYNSGGQNGISERTTRRSLSRMGYCSRRPQLSAKIKKKQLQWARNYQHWTIEEWKNFAWSKESRFLLRHADGRVRIWCNQHEFMSPSCLVSTVQAGGGSIMVWGRFSWSLDTN